MNFGTSYNLELILTIAALSVSKQETSRYQKVYGTFVVPLFQIIFLREPFRLNIYIYIGLGL